MAGNSKEKETRPPSSLRHEITIDSTDDESMLDQYSVNESNADDDGPVDDVIARFGVSQKKIRTKNELPTATFLSRPDLAAGNRSPSPSPGYQPFRQVPTTGNPKSGTNITKASKHLRFNPAGLLTPPTSHIGTAVSTTQAEVNFVNARGQGQVADAGIALHVESPSSVEANKNSGNRADAALRTPQACSTRPARDHESIPSVVESDQHTDKHLSQEETVQALNTHPRIDAADPDQGSSHAPLFVQVDDTPIPGKPQPRGPIRRGKKTRTHGNGQQQRTAWPPKAVTSDASSSVCDLTLSTTMENPEQDARHTVAHLEAGVSEHQDVVLTQDSRAPNKVPETVPTTATTACSEPDRSLSRVAPVAEALQPRPTRVSKPQKKSRAPARSSNASASGNNVGDHFAEIFEQQLTGLRVSYYAESVRQQHRWAPEIRSRDQRIAELCEKVKDHESQIQEMQVKALEKDVLLGSREERVRDLEEKVKDRESQIRDLQAKDAERDVKVRCQKEAVKGFGKYMDGLGNDHETFKRKTRAHHEECTTILNNKIQELQGEKASLEQEFLSTVEAMERSQRSTKDALEGCYRSLEHSEWTRIAVKGQLEIQTVRYEEEKARCEQLEKQVITSLEAIRGHLENDHRALLEKLNNINTFLTDKSADKERAAQIQECIRGLEALKEAPLATVEDVRKAQDTLHSLRDTLNSSIGALTTSIEENCFPKKEFLKFVEEQLESLSTQLSKYGKASIELAAKASENRDLEKKLAQLQDQMTEMSKSYEEEVTSLKEQLEKSRSALVKAEAEAKRMEAARADEMAAHKKLTKQKMREKFDEEARAYRQQVDQEMAEELARIRQGIQEANSDHVILPETQDTEVVQETQFDEHGPQLDDHVQYIPESQENVFGEMLFSNRMQPESPSHGRSVANMSSRLAPPGTTEPSSQKRKAPQPDSNNGNTPKHKKAAIDAAIPAYQGRSRVVQDSQSPSQSPSQTPGTGPSSRSAAARRTKSSRYDLRFNAELQ